MKLTSYLALAATLVFPSLLAHGGEPDLPPLPHAAVSFGAAINHGWIYIYGGNTGRAHEFNRDCVKGDCYRLRLPSGSAWETLPPGQPLLSSALVPWKEGVIRIGGMNARNETGKKSDLHSTNEVLFLDSGSSEWRALPALPEPRSSHDAVVWDGVVYIAGGWRLDGDDGDGGHAVWHDTMLSLDLRSAGGEWKTFPQPFKRRALAMAVHAGRIWCVGGMDSNDKPSRAVDWYEPSSGQWGRGPELPDGPMEGFGVAACEESGRLIVSPFSGKVLALSSDGTRWETSGELTPARFFHRLLPLGDGRVIAVGGSNHQGAITTVDIVAVDDGSKDGRVDSAK